MAAIHFPEPITSPPREPRPLDMVEPEPDRRGLWTGSRRTAWVAAAVLVALGSAAWLIRSPHGVTPVGVPSPAGSPSCTCAPI